MFHSFHLQLYFSLDWTTLVLLIILAAGSLMMATRGRIRVPRHAPKPLERVPPEELGQAIERPTVREALEQMLRPSEIEYLRSMPTSMMKEYLVSRLNPSEKAYLESKFDDED